MRKRGRISGHGCFRRGIRIRWTDTGKGGLDYKAVLVYVYFVIGWHNGRMGPVGGRWKELVWC